MVSYLNLCHLICLGIYWRFAETTKTAIDFILDDDYPAENYTVETPDGYLLALHRIKNSGKPTVFLMHGLCSSSSDWLVLGPEKSLGFLLYNEGYDVWMGNARGNRYSRKHKTLNPDKDAKFWNFSWHEIGFYDLPAMIDYILNVTGESSLQYVGHSQGTTVFFVMTSVKPEYNAKIKSKHALSPVVYTTFAKTPVKYFFIASMPLLKIFTKSFHKLELCGHDSLESVSIRTLCQQNKFLFGAICRNFLSLVGVFGRLIYQSAYSAIFSQIPAGSSYKQAFHFVQIATSGIFRQYNYGPAKNMKQYGTPEPPRYDLDKITAPIYLYCADNDLLSHERDVRKLRSELKTVADVHEILLHEFTHVDFLWANDAVPLLYRKVIQDMLKYK